MRDITLSKPFSTASAIAVLGLQHGVTFSSPRLPACERTVASAR